MSNSKGLGKSNTFGGIFSDSEDELEVMGDSIEDEILFRIQEKHEVIIRNFRDFVSNPAFITNKGDPQTNIVDRYSMVGDKICAKTYNIPDNKISRFFKYLDCCRRKNLKMMVYEKQATYSGFMLDFDIYQDKSDSCINESVTYAMSANLVRFLNKYIDLKNATPGTELDYTNIYLGFIKKPKLLYNSEKQCFKDGFHILIPSLKITKETKKFLLDKCKEDDIFKDVFRTVIPTKGYTYKDFIDTNSAHVPVHFLGSSTKIGSPPYYLHAIYKSQVYHDNINNLDFNPLIIKCDDMLKEDENSTPVILCHELSLNWENESGMIRKRQYELKPRWRA